MLKPSFIFRLSGIDARGQRGRARAGAAAAVRRLLPQPHGFEGLRVAGIGLDMDDHAVPEGDDVAGAVIDARTAILGHTDRPRENDHAVTHRANVLDLHVHVLPHIVAVGKHPLRRSWPPVASAFEEIARQEPLAVWMSESTDALRVAAVPSVNNLA